MTEPVATIKKNSREEIRFILDTFKGRRICNIRTFYEADDGSMRPGKGIAFQLSTLPEFAGGVNAALRAAIDGGLIRG